MKNENSDKQFILKHKNIDVLKFSFNDAFEIDNIIDIYKKEHIPLGISTENDNFLKSFQNWWIHRGIPASRDKLQEGLALLNLETVSELLGKSYGVSLSDHYWIKPINQNLEWDNINYYKNSFSDDVGKALFDNIKKLFYRQLLTKNLKFRFWIINFLMQNIHPRTNPSAGHCFLPPVFLYPFCTASTDRAINNGAEWSCPRYGNTASDDLSAVQWYFPYCRV